MLDFDEWLKLRHALWPHHTFEELKNEMEEIYKRYYILRIKIQAQHRMLTTLLVI